MREKLTPLQAKTLDLINEHIAKNGMPPTRQELADAERVYPTAIHDRLLHLEKKGYIELFKGKFRGIRVIFDRSP